MSHLGLTDQKLPNVSFFQEFLHSNKAGKNAEHFPWCSITWGSTGQLTSFWRHPEAWRSCRRWRSFQYLEKRVEKIGNEPHFLAHLEKNFIVLTVVSFHTGDVKMKGKCAWEEEGEGEVMCSHYTHTDIISSGAWKTSPEETMQHFKCGNSHNSRVKNP